MLDIVEIENGKDLGVAVSTVPRAANLLSIQLGILDYATDWGVDLKYFLENTAQFQNESFKAYLIQRLTEKQINVSEVQEVLSALSGKYTFFVGDANETAKGLIR